MIDKIKRYASNNSRWLIPAAIGAAILILVLLFKKVVVGWLQALGLMKTDAEQFAFDEQTKRAKELNTGVTNSVVDQYSRQPASKSDFEWKTIADTIASDLDKTFLFTNTSDAVYQLCRAKNDTDIYKMIEYFGKRKYGLITFFDDAKTLPEWVHDRLSDSEIAKVNDNYYRGGINYRF